MEMLQEQLESLEKWRTKWLYINLVGFCIWDGTRIAKNYLLEDSKHGILTIILLIGWLIWISGLFQLIRFSNKVKKTRQAMHILNDELTQFNRLKAWKTAFLIVCTAQILVIVTSSFITEISGIFVAELSIFLAVVSAIGSFLYYDAE